jgi:mannose-6-phosphate isomerase-like protein (cupin superfamily)
MTMSFEEHMRKNMPGWEGFYREDSGHAAAMVSTSFLKGLYEAGVKEGQRGETGQEGIINPLDMKFVSKRWGWELWICNNDRYCGKKLFIKQGHWLSFHHHNVKDEVLFVESGEVWFTYDEPDRLYNDPQSVLTRSINIFEGQAFHVKPTTKHQIQAIKDTVIFEFSTKHDDADSIRTTTDLVVDHGDNGCPIKTWQRSQREEPYKPKLPLPPNVNFTPSWEKDDILGDLGL